MSAVMNIAAGTDGAVRGRPRRYQPGVAAGEEVCIIPVANGAWPVEVPHRDFWLFDDTELYDMHYKVDGTWLGAEPITDPSRIEQARSWRDEILRLHVRRRGSGTS